MDHDIIELLEYIELPEREFNKENVEIQTNNKVNELQSQIDDLESLNTTRPEIIKVIKDFKKEIQNIYKIKDILIDHLEDDSRESDNEESVQNVYINPIKATKLNPIERQVKRLSYCFNTIFRDNYYKTSSTDFTLTIPDTLKNVISTRLSSIELYNTTIAFNSEYGSNKFKLIIEETGQIFDIIIPSGNYRSSLLVQDLQKYFDTNVNPFLPNFHFIINVDVKTGRTIISNGLGTELTTFQGTQSNTDKDKRFRLEFGNDLNENSPHKSLGWMLGFRHNTYSGSTSYISESIYDSIRDKYVYFCLDDYNKNYNDTIRAVFQNSIMSENILSKIPLNQGVYSINYHNGREHNDGGGNFVRKYNGPVNIKRIGIKLFDAYGEIVNLQNTDFSFTLDFEILYTRTE
jgi:hypothetical protein